MSRKILIARIIGMLVALAMAVTLWGYSPSEASAKVRSNGTVAIDTKTGGVAFKCKRAKQIHVTPGSLYVCPSKGWFAVMRVGKSFKSIHYLKFYKTRKKALKASARSQYNEYLPKCMDAACTRTQNFY